MMLALDNVFVVIGRKIEIVDGLELPFIVGGNIVFAIQFQKSFIRNKM